jgi:hypothetical protein
MGVRFVSALTVAVVIVSGCGGHSRVKNGPITIHLVGKTASDAVRGGGGTGRFTASGAVADSGTFVDFRSEDADSIRIRRVLNGKHGKITTVISIDKSAGDKGWKILSATDAYNGTRGKGQEVGGVDDSGKIVITMRGSVTH